MKSHEFITEDTETFNYLTNSKLRRILIAGAKNAKEVEWALGYTQDAISDDYHDEMIPSSVYDARAEAANSAEESFEAGDLKAAMQHIRQYWRV